MLTTLILQVVRNEETNTEARQEDEGATTMAYERSNLLGRRKEASSDNVLPSDGHRPTVGGAGQDRLKEAVKYDSNKSRMDLVPTKAIECAGHVFGFGALKYNDRNWELGLSYGKLIAALERHLLSIKRREDIDEESGLPHVGHAMCCLMMLGEFMLSERTDLDDRTTLYQEPCTTKPLPAIRPFFKATEEGALG